MVDKLQQDLKDAQIARDETRVSTLRLLLSEVKNAEIAKGTDLLDEDIVSLVQKEEAEAKILQAYLPAQLSNEELTKIIEESITEVGAKSIQDMGRVIGVVMGKVRGQAEGGMISALVKEKLS